MRLGRRSRTDLVLQGFDASVDDGDRGVVSYAPEEPVRRGCYRATAERVRQLAGALQTLGVGPSDRVATLASSTHRHLEVFFAISGIGTVCHTINPRPHADQVAWIPNHAADALMFVDLAFLPQAEAALRSSKRLRHVVMTDRAHMPAAMPEPLGGALCYEELLTREDGRLDWPQFDENTAAALCYTSGTTGDKGVLYRCYGAGEEGVRLQR
jgi:acyl-CoA synthetase (AMP-forming)/AMP-acid ligase II